MDNIISGTGHRPQHITRLGAAIFSRPDDMAALERRLTDLAVAGLRRHGATGVVSGMALGWDTALAEAALEVGLPLTAAIPFEGQEKRWAPAAQNRFHGLLGRASDVVIVCEGGYSPAAMQRRNEWMVEHSSTILALHNGKSGGAANCLRYASEEGAKVVNLWGAFVKHAGLPFI